MANLALIINCHTWGLLGWQLSRSAKASTLVATLEQALIARSGSLEKVKSPSCGAQTTDWFLTSRDYTRLVRGYGLKQEFITSYCPQQYGIVERVIHKLKEQGVHRQRFESLHQATRSIEDWIHFYYNSGSHQALDMKARAEAFRLAAQLVYKPLGQYRSVQWSGVRRECGCYKPFPPQKEIRPCRYIYIFIY